MRRVIPREETVDDGASETHFDAWLGSRVERVIVAVKAVEERGFGCRLCDAGCVWCATFWGREVDGLWSYKVSVQAHGNM